MKWNKQQKRIREVTLKKAWKRLKELRQEKKACDTPFKARGSSWKKPQGILGDKNKLLLKIKVDYAWKLAAWERENLKTDKKPLKELQGKNVKTQGLTREDPREESYR